MSATLLPPTPKESDFFRVAREAAQKTSTPSLNWWLSLEPSRRAVMLDVAKSRRPHPLCSERARSLIGRETDQQPFSTRARIEVRPLVGIEHEGSVTSHLDAAVDWRNPIGHLLQVTERGAGRPPVCLIVTYGREGSPDKVFVPEGLRHPLDRYVAPLSLIESAETVAAGFGEIVFHNGGDDHLINTIWDGARRENLSDETSELISPLLEPVEPAAT